MSILKALESNRRVRESMKVISIRGKKQVRENTPGLMDPFTKESSLMEMLMDLESLRT